MNKDKSGFSVCLFMMAYNWLWKIALPFLKKHPRLKSSHLSRTDPSCYQPAEIWIQAASAGEAKIALSLLKEFLPPVPLSILITTVTSQGMEILQKGRKQIPASQISLNWFPWDCPSSLEPVIDRISPKCMVLLETELWPGLLSALKKRNVPVLILNGRMSRKSFQKYRATKFIWAKLCPDRILAVSSRDAIRFQTVFPDSLVETMPNIKFSGISDQTRKNAEDKSPGLCILENCLPRDIKLSVFASIRRQEESMVRKMLSSLIRQYPDQVIALFPRHMHRIPAWKRLLQKEGLCFCLRSDLSSGGKPGPGSGPEPPGSIG